MANLPWDLVLLLLGLAVIVPWRGVARMRRLLQVPELAPGARIAIYTSTIAAQWVVVGLTLWRCWAHGWSSAPLGVAAPNLVLALAIGVMLAILFGFLQLAGFRGLSQIPVEMRGRIYQVASKLMPRNGAEAAIFVALVATVSLCEEFLYRGFVFAAIRELIGGFAMAPALALIASSLIFGLGHMYQGRRGIFLTSFLGMVFGAARLYTGSLLPGIIAHFVVDLLAGLAAPGGLWEAWRSEAPSV